MVRSIQIVSIWLLIAFQRNSAAVLSLSASWILMIRKQCYTILRPSAQRNLSRLTPITLRNHANVIYEPLKESGIEYTFWGKEKIQRLFNRSSSKVAIKSSRVKACLAAPGELLQTQVQGFTTTVNSANSGDWKITTSTGSQYFLPPALFDKFYRPYKAGIFESKLEMVSYIRINEHIKISAPWGRIQYLRPGDVLVKRRDGEMYGVLSQDFQEGYQI